MSKKNEAINNHIQLQDCKHGYLYKLFARNIKIGVYDDFTKSFEGIRLKFNSRFLDKEYHWDSDPNFGTALPIKELEKVSQDILLDDKLILFNWLEQKEKELENEN